MQVMETIQIIFERRDSVNQCTKRENFHPLIGQDAEVQEIGDFMRETVQKPGTWLVVTFLFYFRHSESRMARNSNAENKINETCGSWKKTTNNMMNTVQRYWSYAKEKQENGIEK
jgi:hypothetical protein